jgi:hypothetical protein
MVVMGDSEGVMERDMLRCILRMNVSSQFSDKILRAL